MRLVLAAAAPCPLAVPPQIVFAGYGLPRRGTKTFCLPDLWSLLIFGYDMDADIDGQACRIEPGMLACLAPGVVKTYHHRHAEQRHLVIHFRCPGRGDARPLPRLLALGRDRVRIEGDLAEAVSWSTSDPRRCAARLWDVLLRLADASAAPSAQGHPAIVEALRRIEAGQVPRSMAAFARSLGLSLGHFTTLFTREVGVPPAEHLRQRRLDRARHLLVSSDLPFRDIAAEVGLPDPQQFNKAVRRAFGCSPRALREG